MKIFSYTVIAATMTLLAACGNTATKDADAENNNLVQIAEAKPEPIVLAPTDTLEFGESQPIPVVVDFWATWCPPCKRFSPIFHKAAEKYNGKIKFISVDVDKCPGIAREYGVESIPTILFVTTKGVINRNVGFMTEDEFEGSLEALLQ
jgi:thioredoxin 1